MVTRPSSTKEVAPRGAASAASTRQRAREFLRVSKDPRGERASNEQQHADSLDVWSGFDFGDPYVETGSASRFRRGQRGADFPALLDDLAADRFDADVLVLWETSRASREVDDWPGLLRLCERAGVRIAVTTDARIYDPSSPHDRKHLLSDAVDAEHASALTSMRVRRHMRANAQRGRPHGKIPFGYRRVYDPETRAATQVIEPEEARIVRELFTRLAAGHSLKAIARDFEARGIQSRGSPNQPARPFVPASLRSMATSPTYAGLRQHRPRGGGEGTVVPGTWEPLVSLDLWHKVRRLLADPSRRTTRPGRGVHLLSRLARCEVCDGILAVGYRRGLREYQCENGHVRCNADELDRFAEVRILDYLSNPSEWEATFGVDDYDERAASIRDEIAEVQSQLDALYARVKARSLSLDALAAIEPGLLDERTAAENRLAALSTPLGLADLVEPGPDVVERWVPMPMPAKREVVRMLLGAGGVLGTLRLGHAPNRQTVPVDERATVRR